MGGRLTPLGAEWAAAKVLEVEKKRRTLAGDIGVCRLLERSLARREKSYGGKREKLFGRVEAPELKSSDPLPLARITKNAELRLPCLGPHGR